MAAKTGKSTKRAAKSTEKTTHIPKYKDVEGNYLVVHEHDHRFVLAWYCPDIDDIGAYIGDSAFSEENQEELDTILTAVRGYFAAEGLETAPGSLPYRFASTREATECLRAVNAALYYADLKRPMPEWATKALSEGWSPPKGWKP